MLVLSRRANESIKLGESIVITVVRVIGDKVRLGIQAPADMVVLRNELEPFSREDEPNGEPPVELPRLVG